MKDKEMIEEMAREIAKRDCYLFDNCPKPYKHACISQNPTIMMESSKNYITFATWLVELGYHKIPKDSVVLSREEYELYDVVKKGYPNDMSCLAEKLTEIDHKARKETAEKIIKMLKQSPYIDFLEEWVLEDVAKELDVEIKES